MAPPSIPLWVFHLNMPSLSKPLVQEFAGASLWFDSQRADRTDPRAPGAPGPEPGAEADEPVTEQAGGLPLVVGEISTVLILPGGLVTAV